MTDEKKIKKVVNEQYDEIIKQVSIDEDYSCSNGCTSIDSEDTVVGYKENPSSNNQIEDITLAFIESLLPNRYVV